MSESVCRNEDRHDHIPLEKESVLERLLAPVIVPDPLPVLPGLASNTQVPVVAMVPQAYILDRIPETVPKRGVSQKAPVLVGPAVICKFDPESRGPRFDMVGLESLKPPQETRMMQQQEVACDRHLPDLLLESVDVCNVAARKLDHGRTAVIRSIRSNHLPR